MNDNNDTSDSRFSYFFLGLGLGVAGAVLFAPRSGAHTRSLLSEKADEGQAYLGSRYADVKQTVAAKYSDVKKTVEEKVNVGAETAKRTEKSVRAAVDAGKEAFNREMNAPETNIV